MTPEALERRREQARLRKKRQRARQREQTEALRAANAEATRAEEVLEEATTTSYTPPAERARGARADGKILGVVGIPRPGNRELGLPTSGEFLYIRGERAQEMGYKEWLDAPHEESRPCSVVAPSGTRLSYFLEVEDVARVAKLLADDFPDVDEMALRSTLASVKPGSTFRLTDAASAS